MILSLTANLSLPRSIQSYLMSRDRLVENGMTDHLDLASQAENLHTQRKCYDWSELINSSDIPNTPHIPRMCYVEDVYHVPCGHWAGRPRIYHRCAGAPDQPEGQLHTVPSLPRFEERAGRYREHGDPQLPNPGMRMSTPCTNAMIYRSARDLDNKCGRCRIDVEKIVSKQTGMWLSFSRDPVTGKTIFKERHAESAASQRARLDAAAAVPCSGTGSIKSGPPGAKRKPVQSQSTWQKEMGDITEDSSSRNGSWSSHGHVEL